MLSVYNRVHKYWETTNVSVCYYEFFIDSSSDLPTDTSSFSEDGVTYKIMQGSLAYDVNADNLYMMNSGGIWVLK